MRLFIHFNSNFGPCYVMDAEVLCVVIFHQSSCLPRQFSLTSSLLLLLPKPFAACKVTELVVALADELLVVALADELLVVALADELLVVAFTAGMAGTGTDDMRLFHFFNSFEKMWEF